MTEKTLTEATRDLASENNLSRVFSTLGAEIVLDALAQTGYRVVGLELGDTPILTVKGCDAPETFRVVGEKTGGFAVNLA